MDHGGQVGDGLDHSGGEEGLLGAEIESWIMVDRLVRD